MVSHLDAELKKLREVVEARQSAAIVAPAGSGKSLLIRSLGDLARGALLRQLPKADQSLSA
jgi:hypothetical protein